MERQADWSVSLPARKSGSERAEEGERNRGVLGRGACSAGSLQSALGVEGDRVLEEAGRDADTKEDVGQRTLPSLCVSYMSCALLVPNHLFLRQESEGH